MKSWSMRAWRIRSGIGNLATRVGVRMGLSFPFLFLLLLVFTMQMSQQTRKIGLEEAFLVEQWLEEPVGKTVLVYGLQPERCTDRLVGCCCKELLINSK